MSRVRHPLRGPLGRSSLATVLAVAACTVLANACLKPSLSGEDTRTPQAAFEALKRAALANSAEALYQLLDRKTQWSIESTLRAQRKMRDLVRAHYPEQRQARELRRTQIAGMASDPASFFFAYGQTRKLLEPLQRLGKLDTTEGSSPSVTLVSGPQRLRFCREDQAWRYCGLRDAFEQLKVRAARDLKIVRESIESVR